jgi:hypothetical protein
VSTRALQPYLRQTICQLHRCRLRFRSLHCAYALAGCCCRCCSTGLHSQLLQQASFLRTERTLGKDGSLIRESPLSKTRQEYEQQGYK